jgi:hypothetical protein
MKDTVFMCMSLLCGIALLTALLCPGWGVFVRVLFS